MESAFLFGTKYKIGEYITINPEKMDSSELNSEENTDENEGANENSEEASVVKNNKI